MNPAPAIDRRTLDAVVPRIYVSLPEVGEPELTLSHENSPVQRPLVADLWVFYAFDFDTHYQIVAHRDLPHLDVTGEELHERALENLRAMNLEVRAHQGEGIWMLTAGGNYEATLLLLPEVWQTVEEMVIGRVVVAVPGREVLFVADDAEPANLSALRRATSEALEKVDKPLSRVFLRWNGETWEKYVGHAD